LYSITGGGEGEPYNSIWVNSPIQISFPQRILLIMLPLSSKVAKIPAVESKL